LHDVRLVLPGRGIDDTTNILVHSGRQASHTHDALRFFRPEPFEYRASIGSESVDVIELDSLGAKGFLKVNRCDPAPRKYKCPISGMISLLSRSHPRINYVGNYLSLVHEVLRGVFLNIAILASF
jgi:hypothetical protein